MLIYRLLKVPRCTQLILSIFLLIWGYGVFSQTFDELYESIETFKNQPAEQETYLRLFLEKAKRERNGEELVNGYRNFMHHTEGRIARNYADSMVFAALQTKDSLLIGSAYLSKGVFYYGLKIYGDALDHYLTAQPYIDAADDPYLKHKAQYNIAQIKYYLGDYAEAIRLLEGCLGYFKENHPRAYLNSLHSLALCYQRKGDIGLSSETVKKGMDEGKRLSIVQMDAYFLFTEGINQYFRENYGSAIEMLSGTLPFLIEKGDFGNEAVGHFYLGKSHWALKATDKALLHFVQVDSLFHKHQYIREDLREAYVLMAGHYKAKGDFEAQVYQLNQLLRADSVLKSGYKHLSKKIHHGYDTPVILKERDFAQKQVEKKSRILVIAFFLIGSLGLAIAFIVSRHFKNKKLYKERFDALMANGPIQKKQAFTPHNGNVGTEINAEAVKAILAKLEKFEKDQKFLHQDWTLFKLAAHFNSNNKYLSLVIHQYRNMNFPTYINNLKIDFIIEQLKSNRKMRKYTQKALAEEAGFSTTQRFTNAFKSYTGISVGFFIEELESQ